MKKLYRHGQQHAASCGAIPRKGVRGGVSAKPAAIEMKSPLRSPSEADEDARRSIRERTELISERVSLVRSDRSCLGHAKARATTTLFSEVGAAALASFAQHSVIRCLPMHATILPAVLDRPELLLAQISALECQRDAVLEMNAPDKAGQMIRHLASLRGIVRTECDRARARSVCSWLGYKRAFDPA